jgi:pimeloyl-ACP methyl ester carboxylesterase
MRHLKIQKADILGYSLGGGVAVRLAIQHPESVNRLAVVSTVFKLDGWYPEVRAAMSHLDAEAAEQMKPSPLYQSYARVAPRAADWPVLVTKVASLIRTDFDWSKEVAAIQIPTLLVFGDADAVRPEHAIEFFQLLGGGKKDGGWDGSGISKARLAILPGVTHYNMLASPQLAPVITEFLTATATH